MPIWFFLECLDVVKRQPQRKKDTFACACHGTYNREWGAVVKASPCPHKFFHTCVAGQTVPPKLIVCTSYAKRLTYCYCFIFTRYSWCCLSVCFASKTPHGHVHLQFVQYYHCIHTCGLHDEQADEIPNSHCSIVLCVLLGVRSTRAGTVWSVRKFTVVTRPLFRNTYFVRLDSRQRIRDENAIQNSCQLSYLCVCTICIHWYKKTREKSNWPAAANERPCHIRGLCHVSWCLQTTCTESIRDTNQREIWRYNSLPRAIANNNDPRKWSWHLR